MKIRIETYEGISATPALPLAVEGWHELIKRKLADDQMIFNWDSNALVAFVGKKPVGVLLWAKIEWQKRAYVNLGYVQPDYRRRGIYRQLFAGLVEKAREAKLREIQGITYTKNSALRKFAGIRGAQGIRCCADFPCGRLR
ncbi:MAG: GNAT family N-acetyltransferase [Methylovirgula sp.]